MLRKSIKTLVPIMFRKKIGDLFILSKKYLHFRRFSRRKLSGIDPVSRCFGYDRGKPIDRYYIESFLAKNHKDISGVVMEVGDSWYTRKYGINIKQGDVLHCCHGNNGATVIGDLAKKEEFTPNVYDCVICTQTLQFIYNIREAFNSLHLVLKPNGVLLATISGISQISRYDAVKWGDYWRLTDMSLKRMAEDVFGEDNVEVTAFGNVFASCAFLYGLSSEELTEKELQYFDKDYQLLLVVRAVKRQ